MNGGLRKSCKIDGGIAAATTNKANWRLDGQSEAPMIISGKPNKNQNWRTPQDWFNSLDRIFHFTIDACASPSNALLDRYWTAKDDSSRRSWAGERAFCNPPFSGGGEFLANASGADLAVVVWPLNSLTAQRFHRSNPPTMVFIPDQRIQFVPPRGLRSSSNTGGVCFLIYGKVTPGQSRELNRLRGMKLKVSGWLGSR